MCMTIALAVNNYSLRVRMNCAPLFSSCLMISSSLQVGLMVVTVSPAPAQPRKAMGNSGMLGRMKATTSPLCAPSLLKADPNLVESDMDISYVYWRPDIVLTV